MNTRFLNLYFSVWQNKGSFQLHHWFTCVQLPYGTPAGVLAPTFPFRSPQSRFQGMQQKVVWRQPLNVLSGRPVPEQSPRISPAVRFA